MAHSKSYRNYLNLPRKWELLRAAAESVGMVIGNNITGKSLRKGMKVLAYYNDINVGVDVIEILGVTNNDQLYGASGAKFDTVKEMLIAHGVNTLKQVEELDHLKDSQYDGWGYHTYLYTRDLTHEEGSPYPDEGAWYYIFEGRWARGSGAEKLSFIELLDPPAEAIHTTVNRYQLALKDGE